MGKRLLRGGVLLYLAVLLIVPLAMICYRTFQHGLSPFWNTLTSADGSDALKLSVEIAAISVAINLVFGVGAGWLIARRKMPLRWLVNVIIDLPFAMSPVVIGLAVYALYGRLGWFGPWLIAHNFPILFTVKGMVIATTFVCLPLMVRETVPVLEEIGTDQEQAASVLGASAWQGFWRVTIPAMRWALIYGVVLTAARALGEFGAVAIVSSNLVGQSQTLPLYIDSQYGSYNNTTAAYSAGFLLAIISVLILAAMTMLSRRRNRESA